MSTIPTKPTPATAIPENIQNQFQRLAATWRAETAYLSSTSDIVAHPAFQEIVSMGPVLIPLLLRELENRTGQWHRALSRITGVNPVPQDDRGNMNKTIDAWLRWGREQGYQW
jgi:hypothetical protein